jgi:hypothetical protein
MLWAGGPLKYELIKFDGVVFIPGSLGENSPSDWLLHFLFDSDVP